jgi:hypothetical protein
VLGSFAGAQDDTSRARAKAEARARAKARAKSKDKGEGEGKGEGKIRGNGKILRVEGVACHLIAAKEETRREGGVPDGR